MFAAMTVTTLIDARFNTILRDTINQEPVRTAFLGAFSTVLFIVSYLLQAGLTHRVLAPFRAAHRPDGDTRDPGAWGRPPSFSCRPRRRSGGGRPCAARTRA